MIDSQPKIIRENTGVVCPHCSNQVIIGVEWEQPRIVTVVSSKQASEAKNAVKAGAEMLPNLELGELEAFRKWVDLESTVIGPSDVELVLSNLGGHAAPKA